MMKGIHSGLLCVSILGYEAFCEALLDRIVMCLPSIFYDTVQVCFSLFFYSPMNAKLFDSWLLLLLYILVFRQIP
jgi:hypothetical protein